MEFNFQHNNHHYVVTVQKTAEGQFSAEINGRKFPFEFGWISPDCLSVVIDNVFHTVYVSQQDKSCEVFVKGDHLVIEDLGRKSQISRSVADEIRNTNENTVSAPMPGRILKILVGKNQQVKNNQPLFILESMKMENEVQSPRDGKIARINFKVNDLVSLGDPIIELENLLKK